VSGSCVRGRQRQSRVLGWRQRGRGRSAAREGRDGGGSGAGAAFGAPLRRHRLEAAPARCRLLGARKEVERTEEPLTVLG
jgi:hypothetical protein